MDRPDTIRSLPPVSDSGSPTRVGGSEVMTAPQLRR